MRRYHAQAFSSGLSLPQIMPEGLNAREDTILELYEGRVALKLGISEDKETKGRILFRVDLEVVPSFRLERKGTFIDGRIQIQIRCQYIGQREQRQQNGKDIRMHSAK